MIWGNEILDYLFIGSEEHASNLSQLKEHNISSVFGCRNMEYFNLPVLNLRGRNFSQHLNDFPEILRLYRTSSFKMA